MFNLDIAQLVKGSLTAAGTIGPLNQPQAKLWTVLLNASAIATANITVAIQVFDPQSAAFVTPASIGNPLQTNPFVITLATVAPLILIPGPLSQVQINIASFGTSTGTFTGAIWCI